MQVPPPEMVTRYGCVLEGCGWSYSMPWPVPDDGNPGAITIIPGEPFSDTVARVAAHANRVWTRTVDEQLKAHLNEHRPEQFARQLLEQQDRVAAAEGAQETVDRVRQWFELYRPAMSRSAAGDLALILEDSRHNTD